MAFTVFEKSLKMLSGLMSVPLSPFIMKSVNQNTRRVVMRFGKVDRVCEPGIRWIPIGANLYDVFLGARTHKFTGLRVSDKHGTPIIVSAILNYNVDDPAKFIIGANGIADVVFNVIEGAIRDGCQAKPLVSDNEEDLRRHSDDVSQSIKKDIVSKIDAFGITIGSLKLTEMNYSPEIMQHMLMKQQANAYIEARTTIVDGTIGIVKEVIKKFPNLSVTAQEWIISNLMTTLSSNNPVSSVIQLK